METTEEGEHPKANALSTFMLHVKIDEAGMQLKILLKGQLNDVSRISLQE